MTKHSAQIYLVLDAGPTAAARLAAITASVPAIAALLVRGGPTPLTAAQAQPLVEGAQNAGIAALIEGDVRLARTLRADGVHLLAGPDLAARFAEAREILGQRGMIGAEIDAGAEDARHLAMTLAEAGADYIAFGAGAAQTDLAAWWSEIFEVPCVVMAIADADRAAALMAHAAPEFIAVTLAPGATAADCASHVAAIAAAAGSSSRVTT